jgi:propanol-preferring alcohol dehydrogenase
MKAALLEADGSVHVGEYQTPSPEGAAIVRVKAAGVCGTELHFLDGILRPNAYPFILGHEVAGVVEEVPRGETRIRPGDRVTVYNLLACWTCRQCRAGRENMCDAAIGQIGFNLNGGFAEYVRVPPVNLVAIADSLSFETAAVVACSGMAAVHGVRAAGVGLGATAVVNGAGGVGLMVMQAARLAGARVIAVGDSDARLALAREFGADATLRAGNDADYEALPGQVRDLTGGFGADYFFELVGTTGSMRAGFGSLAKAGVFTIIGYTGQDLVVNPVELLINEQRLTTCVAATKRDLEDAVRLAEAGKLQASIGGRMPLQDVREALSGLRERRVLGRNVLVPA